MRKGSAKISWLFAAIVTAFILVATAPHARAQGGEGRSDSVRLPGASEEGSRRTTKSTFRNRRPAPKVILPETGRVTLKINEGNSRVQIFQLGSGVPVETIDVPERGMPLIIRTFDVGAYTVKVQKPGFHDEIRVVEIEKDQGRRVSIDLRPKMATLSVASNIADAKIAIDKLGEFERPVEKALVKPGSYIVKVSRRGYVSRSVTVDLKHAGSEETLNVILEPLRIDAVLDLAFDHIEKGRLDEAEAVARDVLELNPQHARANLALGMAALHRPDIARAVDRILLAISGGETFSLPVLVLADPADTKTTNAIFKLDSRAIRFESADRPGLNFAIATADLGKFESDGNALTVTGRSSFHGRPIEPNLMVYSPLFPAGCRAAATRRTCTSDLNLLTALIAEWRLSTAGR